MTTRSSEKRKTGNRAILSPIDPMGAGGRATISVRVYQSLRKAILSLRLQPGDSLSEAEMAMQLGTSRQPVREAFIKLAETGFVDIVPQRGTFVRRISSHEVGNARFIREHMEAALVRRAAERGSAVNIARLKSLIAEQKQAESAADHNLFIELDDAFHRTIAICAECESAWRVIDEFKGQMDRVRYLSIQETTPIGKLIEQHVAIADAIAAHDPDAAEKAMHSHLSEMLTSLPMLAGRHGELFSD